MNVNNSCVSVDEVTVTERVLMFAGVGLAVCVFLLTTTEPLKGRGGGIFFRLGEFFFLNLLRSPEKLCVPSQNFCVPSQSYLRSHAKPVVRNSV